MKKLQRAVALLLTALLCIGMIPISVLAQENNTQEEPGNRSAVQCPETAKQYLINLAQNYNAISMVPAFDSIEQIDSDWVFGRFVRFSSDEKVSNQQLKTEDSQSIIGSLTMLEEKARLALNPNISMPLDYDYSNRVGWGYVKDAAYKEKGYTWNSGYGFPYAYNFSDFYVTNFQEKDGKYYIEGISLALEVQGKTSSNPGKDGTVFDVYLDRANAYGNQEEADSYGEKVGTATFNEGAEPSRHDLNGNFTYDFNPASLTSEIYRYELQPNDYEDSSTNWGRDQLSRYYLLSKKKVDQPVINEALTDLETIKFWMTNRREYMEFIHKTSQFPHAIYMASNDENMFGIAELAIGNLIFQGTDGIRNLINGETSIENAEKILIGFINENEEEVNALATAKAGKSWGSMLQKILQGYLEAREVDQGNINLIKNYMGSDKFAEVMKNSGYKGVEQEVINLLPESSRTQVHEALDDFQISKDLSKGLGMLGTGFKVIDLGKMSIDGIYNYCILKEMDTVYLDILQDLSQNCAYSVVRDAAKNLYDKAQMNLNEAAADILSEQAVESGIWLAEEAWSKAIDKVYFLKACEVGKNLAVFYCNNFFHTSDALNLKDSMRTLTFMGLSLSSYSFKNMSEALKMEQSNPQEAENYAHKTVYGLRMLWKTRQLGEETYQKFAGIYPYGQAELYPKSKSAELLLNLTKPVLFEPDKEYANYKIATGTFSCPVNIEIYNENDELIITLEDGKEISGQKDGVNYEVYYNPETKEYDKLMSVDNCQNYYIKIIGLDKGVVNSSIDTVGENGTLKSYRFNDVPVEKDTVITTSILTTNEPFSYKVVDAGGTEIENGTAMESDFSKYIPLENIDFKDVKVEMKVGEQQIINRSFTPENASYKHVTWTSSDDKVAQVNTDGVVTAVSEGKVTITATTQDGNKTASCKVTISNNQDTPPKVIPVSNVTLNKTKETVSVGQKFTLRPIINPENATEKAVSWSSSSDKIAIVDENGLVTAVSEGKTLITVTTKEGNKTASCEVTVTQDEGDKVSEGDSLTTATGQQKTIVVNGELNPFTGMTLQEKINTMIIWLAAAALCAAAVLIIKRRAEK